METVAPRVLVIVDMLNPLRTEGSDALARPAVRAATAIAALKRRLGGEGVPAIYVNDTIDAAGCPWCSDFGTVVQHCVAARGPAAALARRLAPAQGDTTILKPGRSAFTGTPLDALLRRLGARELVLTGVAADAALMFSAMHAAEQGYALWVPADCTAAASPLAKRAALAWMARVLGADTRPAQPDATNGTPLAEPGVQPPAAAPPSTPSTGTGSPA